MPAKTGTSPCDASNLITVTGVLTVYLPSSLKPAESAFPLPKMTISLGGVTTAAPATTTFVPAESGNGMYAFSTLFSFQVSPAMAANVKASATYASNAGSVSVTSFANPPKIVITCAGTYELSIGQNERSSGRRATRNTLLRRGFFVHTIRL